MTKWSPSVADGDHFAILGVVARWDLAVIWTWVVAGVHVRQLRALGWTAATWADWMWWGPGMSTYLVTATKRQPARNLP
jgi:hypothetical protein